MAPHLFFKPNPLLIESTRQPFTLAMHSLRRLKRDIKASGKSFASCFLGAVGSGAPLAVAPVRQVDDVSLIFTVCLISFNAGGWVGGQLVKRLRCFVFIIGAG